MKKLFILIVVLLSTGGIFLSVFAQSVFGWEVAYPFPTNDIATLSASQTTFFYPEIPGMTNENSLQIDIEYDGTGYLFIKKVLEEPITIPTWCFITTNLQNQNLGISVIFKYEDQWYAPGQSNDLIVENWYNATNNSWHNLFNSDDYPLDHITLDTVYLYLQYSANTTAIFDTWYYKDSTLSPKLICGFGDVISDVEPTSGDISQYQLSQNYPNPFNPTTTITFNLPHTGFVKLNVYNIMGQIVKTLISEELAGGDHSLSFDGSSLPSGVYFYRIQMGDFVDTKKFVLLK